MFPDKGLDPGLAESQATHFTASGLLDSIHESHSQVPGAFLNLAIKSSVFKACSSREIKMKTTCINFHIAVSQNRSHNKCPLTKGVNKTCDKVK